MAPHKSPQDHKCCPYCGNTVPSPGAGAEQTPPQPDAFPSDTELNRALAQAQWVLALTMIRASNAGNGALSQRCENLSNSAASHCADLSQGLFDESLPDFLMAAAELGYELASTYGQDGDEDAADDLSTLAEDLIDVALLLAPDFWTAEPIIFD